MRGLSKPISSISLIFASSSGPSKRSPDEEPVLELAVVVEVAGGFSTAEVVLAVVDAAVVAG